MSAGLDAHGEALWQRVHAHVAHGADARLETAEFESLALEIFAWQRTRCAAIDRVACAFGGAARVTSLDELRAVPTDAFKTARIACFGLDATTRVFRTSGTTRDVRGEHELADTSLYERATIASAQRWLLPQARYRFVLLAEPESDAPNSSLSFMLARFVGHWSLETASSPWMIDDGVVAIDRVRAALAASSVDGVPAAVLGATFAFVHVHDALATSERFVLPPGSVAMPTGGYKGRSRELQPDALFALINERLGLARSQIVQEYGMTELSSQAYEAPVESDDSARAPRSPQRPSKIGTCYVAPPWMQVTAVDPETLAPLPHGARGILRVVDLANVGSCIAIQTADLGITHEHGFEVLGRAPGATPRGCARALDALLTESR